MSAMNVRGGLRYVRSAELLRVGVGYVDQRRKAKLYRFDSEKSEWKERGLGIIKLLEHKETKKA
eukprot:5678859-Pyramimonas_sp.AAC.1